MCIIVLRMEMRSSMLWSYCTCFSMVVEALVLASAVASVAYFASLDLKLALNFFMHLILECVPCCP